MKTRKILIERETYSPIKQLIMVAPIGPNGESPLFAALLEDGTFWTQEYTGGGGIEWEESQTPRDQAFNITDECVARGFLYKKHEQPLYCDSEYSFSNLAETHEVEIEE